MHKIMVDSMKLRFDGGRLVAAAAFTVMLTVAVVEPAAPVAVIV